MGSDEAQMATKLKVIWEYAEKTIHGHEGWVPMKSRLSEELETAYKGNPLAVIRVPTPLDDGPNSSGLTYIVWKIDIGNMSQRRLVNGKDKCGRKIRRIFALGSDSDDDSDGPPEAQKAWPRSGPPVGNKQEKWLQEPWNKV